MLLNAFTAFHVILSLIGIIAGFVVVYGMLTARRFGGWTSLFLWSTVATSVTGFMFPVHKFLPSHAVGILSLIVLAVAIWARNRYRRTYVITSLIALYFNVFVLIVQSFEKVPALKELAPTQSEPPFQVAQLTALVIFIAVGVRATMKFRMEGTA
jgi:hypothetical protein